MMSVRYMSMVGGFLVIASLMVFGRFLMMTSGMFVMFGCFNAACFDISSSEKLSCTNAIASGQPSIYASPQ